MAWEKFTVKYRGVSYEESFGVLDVAVQPSDADMKRAVGRWLADRLNEPADVMDYVLELPEAERLAGMHDDKTVLALRPLAVFAFSNT